MKVKDDRGLGKQLKRLLPSSFFRALTVVYNNLMRLVPFKWKYGLGMAFCRNRAPYRFLQAEDTIVQVGCARDILYAGRSRVIYFSRVVPRGRVILIEADAKNCESVRQIISQHGLDNIELVELGAWRESTILAFLSSPNHPAANLLVDANDVTPELVRDRQYEQKLIEVDTIDNILTRLDAAPSLVSITTNGAELPILAGMPETIARGCKYISLASTGEGFHQQMNLLGYEYVARDDRGYCFHRNDQACTANRKSRAA